MDTSTMMTRSEREDLSKVVRRNAKVTKASIEALTADRKADVERQLSAIYKADAKQWRDITAEAERLIGIANAQIARISDERGIRPEFRPGLSLGWRGRGENAVESRRVELRKSAYARIEAHRKAAYLYVESWEADKLNALVSGALSSAEAKAFLNSLPSPETLLPPIKLTGELDGVAEPHRLREMDRDRD
jgi:hypothetical protein